MNVLALNLTGNDWVWIVGILAFITYCVIEKICDTIVENKRVCEKPSNTEAKSQDN